MSVCSPFAFHPMQLYPFPISLLFPSRCMLHNPRTSDINTGKDETRSVHIAPHACVFRQSGWIATVGLHKFTESQPSTFLRTKKRLKNVLALWTDKNWAKGPLTPFVWCWRMAHPPTLTWKHRHVIGTFLWASSHKEFR